MENTEVKRHKNKRRRFMIFIITAAVILLIAVIHIIHAVVVDRNIQYREISFSSENIPAELNGYKIAFISDTHYISQLRLQEIVDELNNRQIDLLLLGGDYSYNGGKSCMEILSQVQAADGIFGVDGNHDNHVALFENMEKYGITPLENTGLYIQDGFYLAGTADLWRARDRWETRAEVVNPCISTAIGDSESDDFVLLVSHNPDISIKQDTTGVDLILSGHTHGGQITFFGLFAPGLWFISDYGHKFKTGWASGNNDTPVYVGNGAGEYIPRIFARPQVILLTLESE
jgi:hypothetical protein